MSSWTLPLFLLITFELVADVFAKKWQLTTSYTFAALALLSYVVANSYWLLALKNGSGLIRGANLFSVSTALVATLIGLVYGETMTVQQVVGLGLGTVAVFLLT